MAGTGRPSRRAPGSDGVPGTRSCRSAAIETRCDTWLRAAAIEADIPTQMRGQILGPMKWRWVEAVLLPFPRRKRRWAEFLVCGQGTRPPRDIGHTQDPGKHIQTDRHDSLLQAQVSTMLNAIDAAIRRLQRLSAPSYGGEFGIGRVTRRDGLWHECATGISKPPRRGIKFALGAARRVPILLYSEGLDPLELKVRLRDRS